jgi:hypothetical protein
LKPSVRLALYAGLTSLFATLLYDAVVAFISLSLQEKIEQIETIAFVSILSLLVVDPFIHRIVALVRIAPSDGEQHRELEAVHVRLFTVMVIVFVSVCDGLLHEYLGRTISPKGWIGIEQTVSSLIGPTVITFAWLRGLAKAPPQAAKYGLIVGIVFGILIFGIYAYFVTRYSFQHVPISPGISIVGMIAVGAMVAFLFLWVILTLYFPSGFLGGLTLDRGWYPHAWQRVLAGLGAAAIVQPSSTLLVLKVLAIVAHPKNPPDLSVATWVIPALVGNIGWALAFYLDSDADNLLRTDRALSDATEPSLKAEATKLLTGSIWMFVCAAFVGLASLLAAWTITATTLKPTAPTWAHSPDVHSAPH